MDLSPSLIEGIIMFAFGGLCFWLWYLKGRCEDIEKTADKKNTEVRDLVRDLQLDLAKNYHGKDDIQIMLKESLQPLHDLLKDLKIEVKHLRDRDRNG